MRLGSERPAWAAWDASPRARPRGTRSAEPHTTNAVGPDPSAYEPERGGSAHVEFIPQIDFKGQGAVPATPDVRRDPPGAGEELKKELSSAVLCLTQRSPERATKAPDGAGVAERPHTAGTGGTRFGKSNHCSRLASICWLYRSTGPGTFPSSVKSFASFP